MEIGYRSYAIRPSVASSISVRKLLSTTSISNRDWNDFEPQTTFKFLQHGLLATLQRLLSSFHVIGSMECQTSKRHRKKKPAFGEMAEICLLFKLNDSEDSITDEENKIDPVTAGITYMKETWREFVLTIGALGFMEIPDLNENRDVSQPEIYTLNLRKFRKSLQESKTANYPKEISELPKRGGHYSSSIIVAPGELGAKTESSEQYYCERDNHSRQIENVDSPTTKVEDFEANAKFLFDAERDVWNSGNFTDGSSTELNKQIMNDIYIYRTIYCLAQVLWISSHTIPSDCRDLVFDCLGSIIDHAVKETEKDAFCPALKPMDDWGFWCNMFLLWFPKLAQIGNLKSSFEDHRRYASIFSRFLHQMTIATGERQLYECANAILAAGGGPPEDKEPFVAPILRVFITIKSCIDHALNFVTQWCHNMDIPNLLPTESNSDNLVLMLRPHLLVIRSAIPFFRSLGDGTISRVNTVLVRAVSLLIHILTDLYSNDDLSSVNAHHPSDGRLQWTKFIILSWTEDLFILFTSMGSIFRPWSNFVMEPVAIAVATVKSPDLRLWLIEFIRRMLLTGCLEGQSLQLLLEAMAEPISKCLLTCAQPSMSPELLGDVALTLVTMSDTIELVKRISPELFATLLHSECTKNMLHITGTPLFRELICKTAQSEPSEIVNDDYEKLSDDYLSAKFAKKKAINNKIQIDRKPKTSYHVELVGGLDRHIHYQGLVSPKMLPNILLDRLFLHPTDS